jgi:hypothetical protein
MNIQQLQAHQKPEFILNFPKSERSITSIDFHPNSKQIAYTTKDSEIQLINLIPQVPKKR